MIERTEVGPPFSQDLGIDILQGFHGPWSHKRFTATKDLSYAVDFKLPLGTSILAAKGGIVVLVFDMADKCYQGTDADIGNGMVWGETNYALIDHDDGTMALYSHLEKDSGVLKRDQEVKVGQNDCKDGFKRLGGPYPPFTLLHL